MKRIVRYSIALVLFMTLQVSAFAGSVDKGYKALVQYDYFKAKKAFTKGLKYNASPSAQGLAIIYYRKDNPFHNLDSAYKYANLSLEGWDMTKQTKKDKWAIYGYTDDSLFSLRQSISTAFFNKAHSAGTELAMAEFVVMHPWAHEKASAIAIRDSIAFFEAVKVNEAIAYKEFLDKYPESVYAALALDNYFDSQFEEMTSDGSLDSYVLFIEENPDSPLRPKAEQSVYAIVTAPGDDTAYRHFIETYTENHYVDTAWMALYQYYLADYSVDVMHEFLQLNPPFIDYVEMDIRLIDSVFLPSLSNEAYGFMNENGQVLIPNVFEFAGFFQEGLAPIVSNGKYGFINKQGVVQIPCQFESAGDFVNGRAIVELNEHFGMIDRNGRFIFECKYDDLGNFSEGLAYASIAELYGYYNEDAVLVVEHQFDDAYDFIDGKAKVEKHDYQAFIDQTGEFLVPMVHENIKPYNDTMYVFYEDGSCGIMNHRAQIFVEPMYQSIGMLSDGLAIAALDNRVVYLDSTGTMVIDNGYETYPNFLLKGAFQNGTAIAVKKGKYGRISTKDKIITDFDFDNLALGDSIITAQKDDYWGVFSSEGKTILVPKYNALTPTNNGVFIATVGDKMGVINRAGDTIVPFMVQRIENLVGDIFLITRNGKEGLYKNEQLIVPIDFEQIGLFNEEFIFLSKDGHLAYYNMKEEKYVELTEE